MEPGFEAWWTETIKPGFQLRTVIELKPFFEHAWETGYYEGTLNGYEECHRNEE